MMRRKKVTARRIVRLGKKIECAEDLKEITLGLERNDGTNRLALYYVPVQQPLSPLG